MLTSVMVYQTKISILRDRAAAGDWVGAMRLAARFPSLGAEKEAITRAWDARQSPALYRQLGRDPDALWEEGIRALRRRYLDPA